MNQETKIKMFNIMVLLSTAHLFVLNHSLYDTPIHKVVPLKLFIWFALLYPLAFAQFLTITCNKDTAIYRWSNSILTVSGLVLLVVGYLFNLGYPPYSWQMSFYPTVGLLFGVLGHQLNKKSRYKRYEDRKCYRDTIH